MDLKLCESGNGGDLIFENNDIKLIPDFANQPYISMFGGNVEENTFKNQQGDFRERFDWWGNDLIFPDDSDSQFNSDTERSLNNNALTTQGRNIIEQAVKKDINFIDANKIINISIPEVDKIEIDVKLEADSIDKVEFNFSECDSYKQQIITALPDGYVTDGYDNVFTDGAGNPFSI